MMGDIQYCEKHESKYIDECFPCLKENYRTLEAALKEIRDRAPRGTAIQAQEIADKTLRSVKNENKT